MSVDRSSSLPPSNEVLSSELRGVSSWARRTESNIEVLDAEEASVPLLVSPPMVMFALGCGSEGMDSSAEGK